MLFDPYALASSAPGAGISGLMEMAAVQGPTPHSAIKEPVNASQCFDGLDANLVIQFLKEKLHGGIFTDLRKYVAKSYSKNWNGLNEQQRRQVEILFRGLTEEQLEVLRNSIEDHKNPLKGTDDCTKDDMVRLLELRSWSDYQMIWSRALGALDRVELDDEKDKAWNELAVIFNNREESNMFQPVNCTVSYNVDGEKERRFNPLLKRNEYVPTTRNTLIHQDVADELGDLIPNEKHRPNRTGAWIKDKYRDIKSRVATVSQCFFKSGLHKGDEKSMEGIREWVISFSHGDVVAAYAFTCLPLYYLKTGMGKFMPEGVGRDTGLISALSPELEQQLQEAWKERKRIKSNKRQEQRMRKKNAVSHSVEGNHSARMDDKDDSGEEDAGSKAMLEAAKISGLGLLLNLPEYQKTNKRGILAQHSNAKIAAKRHKAIEMLEKSCGVYGIDDDEPHEYSGRNELVDPDSDSENDVESSVHGVGLSYSTTGTPAPL